MYFSTQRPDAHIETGVSIDLEMHIEEYWKAVDAMKLLTYMIASGETQAEISGVLKKIFKLCAPFAVSEKHRIWLIDKANE